MRQLLPFLFLPFLLAIDGDDDLKKFIGVPSDLDKDEDYESTVKQLDEGMPIAPFPPNNKESRVSSSKVMHEEEEDYSDLLSPSPSTDSPSKIVHILEEIDESPVTETANKHTGANRSLKLVTLAPFKPTYRIPVTTPSPFIDPRNPAGYGPSSLYRPGQSQTHYTPAPRTFNYFQHYPFYRLPKAWRLRPDIIYTYPSDRQDTNYQYPHGLPYKDIYGFLRHPNPYGCGPGVSYATSPGGCGGGSGSSNGFERPIGSLNENGKGEWTENDDLNLANKEDPLEDISLETLEKIDKAGKSQDRKDKGITVKHPTLIEDDDLIDGHQFMPIGKDEEKFTKVGEESLIGIGSKDEVKEAEEIGKDVEKEKNVEKEKITPEALEELKAFEQEFSNLPPRFSDDNKETN
ncbi:hypothetical protein PENTCL1PPCAC_11272 [Pristionchus entomophagus]|uniref:Uncharacterized protein n=1 Tax=Pristionchus entomophagus TaxID=358040 RepID=A0AAV5T0J0_9BILA|nr:hypothetical protein PENTCL1PPCAC_11272 [Pristionchus entomophagus]